MKPLKRASQKNVEVCKDYYTVNDINSFLRFGAIFYIDDNHEVCQNEIASYEFRDLTFRIDLEKVSNLKVVLDDNGSYTNMAVLNCGLQLYIML